MPAMPGRAFPAGRSWMRSGRLVGITFGYQGRGRPKGPAHLCLSPTWARGSAPNFLGPGKTGLNPASRETRDLSGNICWVSALRKWARNCGHFSVGLPAPFDGLNFERIDSDTKLAPPEAAWQSGHVRSRSRDELKRSYLDYAMSVIVSARAARCARRAEARAPPHPLFDARERPRLEQALSQIAR